MGGKWAGPYFDLNSSYPESSFIGPYLSLLALLALIIQYLPLLVIIRPYWPLFAQFPPTRHSPVLTISFDHKWAGSGRGPYFVLNHSPSRLIQSLSRPLFVLVGIIGSY